MRCWSSKPPASRRKPARSRKPLCAAPGPVSNHPKPRMLEILRQHPDPVFQQRRKDLASDEVADLQPGARLSEEQLELMEPLLPEHVDLLALLRIRGEDTIEEVR